MSKKVLIIGIFVMLIVLFSGCAEEKTTEGSNYKISIKITNLASNDIFANIEAIGEGYTYNKEIFIKTGNTNITGFGTATENTEDIDIKITVKYADLPEITDVFEGSYRGYGFHANYKIYGAIIDINNAIIDIRGPSSD